MDLARDALTEITELAPSKECVVGLSIQQVEEGLRGGVIKALSPDSGLPSTAIWKWFKREGISLSERSIQRHRGGSCGCSR